MEDNKKVFVVKNNYDEIQAIYPTESEAKQLSAYLNGKYLRNQDSIHKAVHRLKYYVKGYTIKEFYRHKKLFWLVVIYFDNHPSPTGCPYSLCNVEKYMLLDYEVEEEIVFNEEMNHIYFTAPLNSTENELRHIACEKIHEIWKNEKIKGY